MTTPESRDKLDSTLTPNYLTYPRSKSERRENSLVCVSQVRGGGLYIALQGQFLAGKIGSVSGKQL